MDHVLLAIGPFCFFATAPSFNMLRNTLEPRWSEQDRVSREPASQFIGAANSTVDINGVFYPDSFIEEGRNSSRDLIDMMSGSANNGDVHSVVALIPIDQSGIALGQFYIRSIQNERTTFDANGAKKISFQVTLKAYGNDSSAATGVIIT